CPATPPAPGQNLVFTGTVTNTGDVALTNVVITNSLAGPTPLLAIAILQPHAGTNFSGSYLVPINACTLTDDTAAAGTSVCGRTISPDTRPHSRIVPTPPAPSITKACPPTPPAPGQLLVFTGTVTNTGNVALTNVVVTNSLATGALLIVDLQPGQGTNFTG